VEAIPLIESTIKLITSQLIKIISYRTQNF